MSNPYISIEVRASKDLEPLITDLAKTIENYSIDRALNLPAIFVAQYLAGQIGMLHTALESLSSTSDIMSDIEAMMKATLEERGETPETPEPWLDPESGLCSVFVSIECPDYHICTQFSEHVPEQWGGEHPGPLTRMPCPRDESHGLHSAKFMTKEEFDQRTSGMDLVHDDTE